ncbi:MAG: type IV pilus modification PilV family protein [Geminicoccaceae bacterium]
MSNASHSHCCSDGRFAAYLFSSSCARGFTLLEVLVALIIFSVAFGAIASLFQTALRQSSAASSQLEALAAAEQQIARFGSELPLELGELSGTVPTADGAVLVWRSHIVLAEPADENGALALFRITVDVAHDDDDHALVSLQTLRIGGTW